MADAPARAAAPFDLATVAEAAACLAPAARSDFAAICAWLKEFERKPNTLRAYRREARRFWAWLDGYGKPLASINRQDIDHYRLHLIGSAQTAGEGLARGLSEPSIRQALIILQALFTYLVDAGYLRRNVLRLVRDKGPTPRRKHRPMPSEGSMLAAIQWMRDLADQARPNSEARAQLRRDTLIWSWSYLAGARRHELGPIRLGHLQVRRAPTADQWFWEVTGKGDKLAYVPVEPGLADLLAWYLEMPAGQLESAIRAHPGKLLLRALRGAGDRVLSASQVYESVGRTATRIGAATKPERIGERDAELMAMMRPHDLRAARATHLLNRGVADRLVQRFMRHANINTTLVYDHTADVDLYAAIAGQDDRPPTTLTA